MIVIIDDPISEGEISDELKKKTMDYYFDFLCLNRRYIHDKVSK